MCSIAKYKVKKAEKLSGRKDNSSARDLFIWLFSSVANYVKIWRKNCPDEKMIAVLVSVGVGVKSDVAIKWGTPGGPRINTLNLHIWSTPSWNTFNFERDEKSIFFRSNFENWILELGFSCLDLGLNTPQYMKKQAREPRWCKVEICECHQLTYLPSDRGRCWRCLRI